MKDNKSACKHIAVLAFPFGSHAAPLLDIIRPLSEACSDTMFSFLSTQQSNNSTFPNKIDKVQPFNVWDGLPEGYRFTGNPHEPVEYFLKAVPGNFTKAIDEAVTEVGKPIDCLITDAFYGFGADIADQLNVPWVAIWVPGPRSLLLHVEIDAIRRHAGINDPRDKTFDFLPGFADIRVADLPDGMISGNIDAPLPAMVNKAGLALSRAKTIVMNSYQGLDDTIVDFLKPRYKMFLSVGPFTLVSSVSGSTVDDSHGCLDWLSMHKPGSVVYIGFGRMVTPPPHELQALSEALEESQFPFLWSFRGNPEQQLPPGFLERTSSKGKIVAWAPQRKVLEHPSVGVFVSHGGWNSVLESIVGGVPMICRPFFGDHGLNTRTLEAVWGFGLGLEEGTLTKRGVGKALNLILCSKEGEKMRERIQVHKELAYKAVKPKGSSAENFEKLVKIVNNTC